MAGFIRVPKIRAILLKVGKKSLHPNPFSYRIKSALKNHPIGDRSKLSISVLTATRRCDAMRIAKRNLGTATIGGFSDANRKSSKNQ